ncbi:MAG: permease [Candidatus Sedimenticola sp. 20ELBAFRAG]
MREDFVEIQTTDDPGHQPKDHTMSDHNTPEQQPPEHGCCGTAVTLTIDAPSESACCSPTGDQDTTACCSTTADDKPLSRLLDRLMSAWLLIAVIPLVVLLLDQARLQEVLSIATSALAGTAPFILFAVLSIAYLKATDAESMVAKAFEGRENRMIVLAALFGGLAPFCSCEVIPFVAGLLAVGAPLSAVMAFWLSSPLIDPPALLITAGALGWEFAIGKAVAAVLLGLFGGFGIKLLLRSGAFSSPLKANTSSGCSSGNCSTSQPFHKKPKWTFWEEQVRRETFRAEAVSNALFLFKWLSLAYLLEALLILYIPASLIGGIVGGEGLGPVILGALVGMPAYLNSYAAPPLVAGLMEQGMSTGSAMAFMVSGSISSIPAMTAVWSLVKREVFVAYLGFGIAGAILFGLGFAALLAL